MQRDSILIGILIVSAGIISIELSISSAVMEITLGFLGSNLLGLKSFEWLDFIALIGLVGLMFLAGFEIDPDILKSTINKSLLIGSLSYFLPFALVFSVSYFYFGYSLITCLVLSLALSTTSIALVYAVLREMVPSGNDLFEIVLGSAMIADVLSMLTLTFLIMEFTVSIIFYMIIILIIILISPFIFKIMAEKYGGHPPEVELRFILLLLLLLPFLAERVYVSEAVFAFFLGVVFSKLIEDQEEIERKLKTIVFGFFAPTFFFKAGLLIDLSYMKFESIILLVFFAIIAYVGKFLGACIPIRILLKDKVISRISGLIFNFRLTFGIVAAVFGLETGILTEELYGVIMFIILSSSIISSIALRKFPYLKEETI